MQKPAETYFGKPCVHGHGSVRYVSNRDCVECRRISGKAKKSRPNPRRDDLQKKRSHAWRERNKEREHERYRRWAASNRERVNEIGRRRAAKMKAAEGRITDDEIAGLEKAQGGLCAYFGYCGNHLISDFHCDHIIPVSRGGPHWAWNRQLVCPTCNSRKGFKDPVAFAEEVGVDPEPARRALSQFSDVGHVSHP